MKAPTLGELIAHLVSCKRVWYAAPMDYCYSSLFIKRVTIDKIKPEKSVVVVHTSETGTLSLNLAEHLERFRICDKV